jgi:hypothetical protein
MREVWRPVVGYEGLYEVSDQGRVRSLDRLLPQAPGAVCSGTRPHRGKVLKLALRPDGYYWTVGLSGHGRRRTRTVHSLVADAFLGPKPPGLFVCHGPAGSRVNTVENLRYGTPAENTADRRRDGTRVLGEAHPNARLTDAQALEVRRRVAAGETRLSLAKELGVSPNSIGRCVKKQSYAHLP